MIRTAIFLLMAAPVNARVPMPAQMICDWVASCEVHGDCPDQTGPYPTFSLEVHLGGTTGVWDPMALWDGFEVMIAQTTDEAISRHLDDSRYGLVLIPSHVTPDGVVLIDGYGLSRPRVDRLPGDVMRFRCRDVLEPLS